MKNVSNYLNILLFILIFTAVLKSHAQIGGISASKLNAFCFETVPAHEMEFEPGFSISKSKFFSDNEGKPVRLFSSTDSSLNESGMRFRFTYGITDKLEAGVTAPVDMSMLNWGMKYRIAKNESNGFALIAGLNTPFLNGAYGTENRDETNTLQILAGSVYTYSITKKFSVDFTLQGGTYFHKLADTKRESLAASADVGYYFFEGKLQVATGLGYQRVFYNSHRQDILTVYPGVTLETGRDFIITLIHSFDLVGHNTNLYKTFDVSFTYSIR